eukprot:15905405-Heterocapsa_arctica.AAC.1
MYIPRAMLSSDITKQQKLVQGAALRGTVYEPPVPVVPRKTTGICPFAALARTMAWQKPGALAALAAAPKADPKAKGVGPLSARSKSNPPPKLHAAPAKASPPTTGRAAIAKGPAING